MIVLYPLRIIIVRFSILGCSQRCSELSPAPDEYECYLLLSLRSPPCCSSWANLIFLSAICISICIFWRSMPCSCSSCFRRLSCFSISKRCSTICFSKSNRLASISALPCRVFVRESIRSRHNALLLEVPAASLFPRLLIFFALVSPWLELQLSHHRSQVQLPHRCCQAPSSVHQPELLPCNNATCTL